MSLACYDIGTFEVFDVSLLFFGVVINFSAKLKENTVILASYPRFILHQIKNQDWRANLMVDLNKPNIS